MRHLLLLAVALWSTTVWAQEYYRLGDPRVLARLSYAGSLVPGQSIRKICISISQDGAYRMFSWIDDAKGPRGLQGEMNKDQLQKLRGLLIAPAFRSLTGNRAGMILDHAETFMAEISRIEVPAAFQPDGKASSVPPRSKLAPPRRLQWLNADGGSPFPAPMAKVIDWMKSFEPTNAKPLDESQISTICPSVGLSLIQPSVAISRQP